MTNIFTLERRANGATLWLDAPAQRNALRAQDWADLVPMLDELRADDGLKLLVLRARGPVFCAGLHFDSIAAHDWAGSNPLDAACAALADFPVPTLALQEGPAFGGGFDLILSCDLRLARRGAFVRLPPARFGILYHPGGMERLAARLGLPAAQRLLLAAQDVAVEDPVFDGFYAARPAADDFESVAQAMIASVMECDARALRALKAQLRALETGRFDRAQAAQDFAALMKAKKT